MDSGIIASNAEIFCTKGVTKHRTAQKWCSEWGEVSGWHILLVMLMWIN